MLKRRSARDTHRRSLADDGLHSVAISRHLIGLLGRRTFALDVCDDIRSLESPAVVIVERLHAVAIDTFHQKMLVTSEMQPSAKLVFGRRFCIGLVILFGAAVGTLIWRRRKLLTDVCDAPPSLVGGFARCTLMIRLFLDRLLQSLHLTICRGVLVVIHR